MSIWFSNRGCTGLEVMGANKGMNSRPRFPWNHNRFTALFPGPPGWAGARRELLDFMVQGKINRGRHTDHPAGCHSIRANQCPPPPSPRFPWKWSLQCCSCNILYEVMFKLYAASVHFVTISGTVATIVCHLITCRSVLLCEFHWRGFSELINCWNMIV